MEREAEEWRGGEKKGRSQRFWVRAAMAGQPQWKRGRENLSVVKEIRVMDRVREREREEIKSWAE